jgi:hypothetical protein
MKLTCFHKVWLIVKSAVMYSVSYSVQASFSATSDRFNRSPFWRPDCRVVGGSSNASGNSVCGEVGGTQIQTSKVSSTSRRFLVLMIAFEFTLVLWLRGITLAEYFRERDPVAGGHLLLNARRVCHYAFPNHQ